MSAAIALQILRCLAPPKPELPTTGGVVSEELVTGATYRYVPQPIEITDEIVDRAFEAGAVWFREHPDGASSDEDWRDFHRTVLMAAELRG